MAIYEDRNLVYLAALAQLETLYDTIAGAISKAHEQQGLDPTEALNILQLDRSLCPRVGAEHILREQF